MRYIIFNMLLIFLPLKLSASAIKNATKCHGVVYCKYKANFLDKKAHSPTSIFHLVHKLKVK